MQSRSGRLKGKQVVSRHKAGELKSVLKSYEGSGNNRGSPFRFTPSRRHVPPETTRRWPGEWERRLVRWERRRISLKGAMRTGDLNSVQALPPNETQIRRKRNEDDVLQMLVEYRRTQSPELRDRIVLRYTNLVESVARRFSGASEPVEDLTQEGYIGLITAVDLYDPAKNVKFSTYATHFIIGQIKHYLRDRGKIIKEPAWLQELNQRMTRAIETLSQQLSRPPSNIEIARLMDLSEETIAEMMMTREVFKVASIDGSDNEEEGGKVDMERQTAADMAVPFQIPVEDRIVLEAALDKLKDLEQQVVTGFYFKSLNQTEIARQLGISCNYVSHILRNSTKKLKKILVTDELRDARLMMAQMRKRLEDQQPRAEQEAIVDGLTRLYNR